MNKKAGFNGIWKWPQNKVNKRRVGIIKVIGKRKKITYEIIKNARKVIRAIKAQRCNLIKITNLTIRIREKEVIVRWSY